MALVPSRTCHMVYISYLFTHASYHAHTEKGIKNGRGKRWNPSKTGDIVLEIKIILQIVHASRGQIQS